MKRLTTSSLLRTQSSSWGDPVRVWQDVAVQEVIPNIDPSRGERYNKDRKSCPVVSAALRLSLEVFITRCIRLGARSIWHEGDCLDVHSHADTGRLWTLSFFSPAPRDLSRLPIPSVKSVQLSLYRYRSNLLPSQHISWSHDWDCCWAMRRRVFFFFFCLLGSEERCWKSAVLAWLAWFRLLWWNVRPKEQQLRVKSEAEINSSILRVADVVEVGCGFGSSVSRRTCQINQ